MVGVFINCLLSWGSQEPGIPEGKEGQATGPGIPTNNVVNELDLEEVCRFSHGGCHASVCLARGWIAGRVVVHQNNSIRGPHDGRSEHLARMSGGFVHCPDRNNVVSFGFELRVEQHGNKVLFLWLKGWICCHDIPPKYEGILRAVEGSPCRAILAKAGLANSSKNDLEGVCDGRGIVFHNNFSFERTPQKVSGIQSPGQSQAKPGGAREQHKCKKKK